MTQHAKPETSTHSPAEPDVPPTYSEAATVNVIIVGECQQGKSTLTQQLARYAGVEDLSIAIGDGNKACTMDVGSYDLSVKLRAFQLVDTDGQPIKKKDYSDLVDLEASEAKVVEVNSADGPTVKFRFVDTPGLNDTEGEDFSIMSRILGRAVDLGHVNALIYVRSIENHFGSSFKNFFRYIQRAMPSICNGLAVVHSRFTVDRVEEYLEDNQRLEDIRRQAFEAATKLELQHFFMDNDPDPKSPFAVVQSLNEIHRLLVHLASQKPLPVKDVKLVKTDAMRHLDIHVINTLKSLSHRLDKDWNQQRSTAEIVSGNALSAQREISKLKTRLEARQVRIQSLKTKDEIILGQKSCVAHYSFIGDLLFQGKLNLGSRVLRYDSDYIISSVTKTCSPGSKWLDEELRGTSWRGEIFGNVFRDINGTVTFYTTSELKHHREIEVLEEAIRDLKDHLATQEEVLARNTGSGTPDGRLQQLGDSIAKIDELIEIVEQETLEVTLWPLLRGFYTKHTFPTPDDMRKFVDVYDESISKLL